MPSSAASPSAAGAVSAPASARLASRTDRFALVVLAAVVAAQLLPLVLLPYLPTQDGPSHQALAYALRVFDRPEGAPLRHYLMRNDEALPNWFVFFLQAKVLAFLPVLVAEKVLVAAYVVLLPLGLRYALRAVRRDAGFLAALGLPFTYNFLFGMGFLNFCWSLAAFLFAFGFYLRHCERFGPRQAVGLALLASWVYACHPVTLVMLLVAVATHGGWQLLLDLGEARAGGGAAAAASWWRAGRERLLWPLVSFVPMVLLLAAFVGRRLDRPAPSLGLLVKLKQLAALYSLVSFDRRVIVPAAGLALLLAAMAGALLWRRRGEGALRLRREDALAAVAVVVALVYLAAPSELAGGGFVNHRLALFPPLALVLWLGGGSWGARARRSVPPLAATLALGMLAILWARWRQIDRYLEEYVTAAERVEDGRTVLPLAFAPAGEERVAGGTPRPLAFRVWPFVHAIGYVAGRRPVVDLGLYEAGEDYFPLRFRPELDPYRHLSIGPLGIEQVPPRVDIAGYQRRGGRVDYVLLWQPQAAPPLHPGTRELYRQLEGGFERVFVSAGGNAELWQAARISRAAAFAP